MEGKELKTMRVSKYLTASGGCGSPTYMYVHTYTPLTANVVVPLKGSEANEAVRPCPGVVHCLVVNIGQVQSGKG